MPNENRWAQKYIEAVRSKRYKQQLWTFLTRKVLQRTEEAIVRGRIRGIRRIRETEGGRTWTYCAKSPIFCCVCFATGSLMVEDYAFSVGKNRMFLLKRSVDQVGYNNCLPRSFERALIVRFQNGTTHQVTLLFNVWKLFFNRNKPHFHARISGTQNCPLYRFKVGNITLLWRLLNQRLLLFNCMFSIGF